jgi:hypothetical protein
MRRVALWYMRGVVIEPTAENLDVPSNASALDR